MIKGVYVFLRGGYLFFFTVTSFVLFLSVKIYCFRNARFVFFDRRFSFVVSFVSLNGRFIFFISFHILVTRPKKKHKLPLIIIKQRLFCSTLLFHCVLNSNCYHKLIVSLTNYNGLTA